MRRVLALGAGGVGRCAVETLLEHAGVSEFVLADRDGDRAAALAERLGVRVTPRRLDVTDARALAAAVDGADVVMNTVGPYDRFGVIVLEAALRAGRAYVDVCDDPAPTLAMLALDGEARRRGVCAVVGVGITPGVSNLLARLAIEALERADRVITGWDVRAALPGEVGPEASASTLHGIAQLTGRIPVHRGGRTVTERPLRRVAVDYPGLGRGFGWTIGHPEPVTLPRAYPDLREAYNVMVTTRRQALAMRVLCGAVDAGLIGQARAARWAERLEGPGGRTPRLEDWLRIARSRRRPGLPPLFAVAEGLRGGAPAGVGVMLTTAPPGGLGGTTGVPLGVGVEIVLRGEVSRPGVLSPEEAFAPRAFLDRLAPRCDPPASDADALLAWSSTWRPDDLLATLSSAVSG